jgi:hypothetical protein
MVPNAVLGRPKSSTMLAPQKMVTVFDWGRKPSAEAETETNTGELLKPGLKSGRR